MTTLYKMRREIATVLGAVFLLFTFSATATEKIPSKTEKTQQLTEISAGVAPIALGNASDKNHIQNATAKLNFIVSFIAVLLVDTPSQEITTNDALLVNRYLHNVFYVFLSANAP